MKSSNKESRYEKGEVKYSLSVKLKIFQEQNSSDFVVKIYQRSIADVSVSLRLAIIQERLITMTVNRKVTRLEASLERLINGLISLASV